MMIHYKKTDTLNYIEIVLKINLQAKKIKVVLRCDCRLTRKI